jgi:hypothetical protein
MFKELFIRNGYRYDYQYDWVIQAKKKERMEMAMIEKMH